MGKEEVVDVLRWGRPWNLAMWAGGQSENLLFLRQRHWSCIKDCPLRSSHCITLQGLKEASQIIVHLFIVEEKLKGRQ